VQHGPSCSQIPHLASVRVGCTIGRRCDTWKIYAVLTKLSGGQDRSRRGAKKNSLKRTKWWHISASQLDHAFTWNSTTPFMLVFERGNNRNNSSKGKDSSSRPFPYLAQSYTYQSCSILLVPSRANPIKLTIQVGWRALMASWCPWQLALFAARPECWYLTVQACPSHCDLGCVCFVLLIVSPHCEQEIINTTQNGMDMPVAVCIVIQIHRWNIIVIYSIFYLLLAGCICLQFPFCLLIYSV